MLRVYTINQRKEWDTIVRSFEYYDVYYLSGYVSAFESHGDGIPLLFYYTSDELRAINVVMKRDIAYDEVMIHQISEGTYFDLKTPYGYGGWLFEGLINKRNEEILSEEYKAWCIENGIVSEWCRFHPLIDNAASIVEMYNVVFMGDTVAIQLDDEQKIWERYSSKNRGHIRVSMKEGVTVEISESREALSIFQKIYKTTMDHDNATPYYYFKESFFNSICEELTGNYSVFTAYLEGKPIASSIMLFAGKNMSYHLSGSLFEYRKYAGTNMILHEAAKWGCENGYQWLHLGGGFGGQKGSLYDFKKSFYKKGEDKKYYVGEMIINKTQYQYLEELRGNNLPGDYFPKYRTPV